MPHFLNQDVYLSFDFLTRIKKIVCISDDEVTLGSMKKQLLTYILNAKLEITSNKNHKIPLKFLNPNIYGSGGLRLDFKESIHSNSKKQTL